MNTYLIYIIKSKLLKWEHKVDNKRKFQEIIPLQLRRSETHSALIFRTAAEEEEEEKSDKLNSEEEEAKKSSINQSDHFA